MFRISPKRSLSCLSLLLAIAFTSGCGVSTGSSSLSSAATSQSPRAFALVITPSAAQVRTGDSQQFSAQILGRTPGSTPDDLGGPHVSLPERGPGNPPHRAMAWSVNGVLGGNSAIGTINSQGLYTAPASLPSSKSVRITAVTGSSMSASAQVTLYELGAGQLAVGPSDLGFGSVAVGSHRSQTATLTAGKSSVTVYTASWNGPGFSLGGISFPLTVPAGQTATYTVTFSPQVEGSAAGLISFMSSATNSPTQRLDGNGVPDSNPTQPPSQPHRVSLNWNPVASIKGYYVYRAGRSGGPYEKISTLQPGTAYTDSLVASGDTYYYVVTSMSKANAESTYSNEVQAVIPTP